MGAGLGRRGGAVGDLEQQLGRVLGHGSKLLADVQAGPVQAALDGAFGHRGRQGGLGDRLALVDDGGDGRPLLVREVGDGQADAGRGVPAEGGLLRPGGRVDPLAGGLQREAAVGWRRARLASRRRAIPHSQAGTSPVPW